AGSTPGAWQTQPRLAPRARPSTGSQSWRPVGQVFGVRHEQPFLDEKATLERPRRGRSEPDVTSAAASRSRGPPSVLAGLLVVVPVVFACGRLDDGSDVLGRGPDRVRKQAVELHP